jgi:GNAT superfamily N-acetyltransferase
MENVPEKPEVRQEKEPALTLRKAKTEDLDFLFKVSTDAMQPVADALGDRKPEEERRTAYEQKFNPEEINVIQSEGLDVGRLRVVRSPESIYIGGIQILPEHQGKGIGTAIFKELIAESEKTGIPILLEVHDVNTNAMNFYKNLGFKEDGKTEKQTILKFIPSTIPTGL